MSATIERDDQYLEIGQYLNLKQDLKLDTEASGSFVLHRDNVGKLSSEILSGGDNKPDDELYRIWVRFALSEI